MPGAASSTFLTTPPWAAKSRSSRAYRSGSSISCWRAAPIEHDGAGTVLTTAQTLLNANRNSWEKEEAEAALAEALGAKQVIWIDEGLANDHTDGHIDNLARFVAPGIVVCQAPAGEDDPNADVLNAIARTLAGACDASGRKLEIVRIPGVGRYRNAAGETSPASHMNFIIANGTVVAPVYGTPSQDAALGMPGEDRFRAAGSRACLRRGSRLWRHWRRLVPLHHPAGAAA